MHQVGGAVNGVDRDIAVRRVSRRYFLMPDSSLISVKDTLCFRESTMAFSAAKSTGFIMSPPAPMPKFGRGSRDGFEAGFDGGLDVGFAFC